MRDRGIKMNFSLCLVLVFAVLVKSGPVNNEVKEECDLSPELIEEIKSYGPTVQKIINAAIYGKFKGSTYNELAKFVDKFGARVSGTQNLENSIDYVLDLMKQHNLDNVHGEEVQVPHWVRGTEEAFMLEPREAPIPVLGLGPTVATPPEGITAEVLVVRSFDELNQSNFSTQAKGKIVVFNNDYVRYGVSVKYRSQGASKAAEHGALAALVRSVTPFSMNNLHTGMQEYADENNKIPVASITVEHARMFQRYQDRGEKIILKLNLQSEDKGPSTSRNVVGELLGTKKPEKVVLVSGHIDSWDVGVGAMDDGGGAFISWNALALLKYLGLSTKRTIRAVLWTAEEPGLIGVQAYNKTHFNELNDFIFVMESDEGTFTPLGLQYTAGPQGGCIIKEIMKLLGPINATQAEYDDAVGSDISIWTGSGIPGGSLWNQNEKYFWFHHSAADTMDVEDPDDLDKNTALWASVAYILADLSIDFPRETMPVSKRHVISKRLK